MTFAGARRIILEGRHSAMFGSLGFPELLFILVLALLVFGPRRLPEVGRTIGRALGEFRRATHDLKRSIDTEINLEDAPASRPAPTGQSARAPESAPAPEPAAPAEPPAAPAAEDRPDEPEAREPAG